MTHPRGMDNWAKAEEALKKLGKNQSHEASGRSPLVMANSVVLASAHQVSIMHRRLYRMSQCQPVMATCQLHLPLNPHNLVAG
jgi:hypothetical protein